MGSWLCMGSRHSMYMALHYNILIQIRYFGLSGHIIESMDIILVPRSNCGSNSVPGGLG